MKFLLDASAAYPLVLRLRERALEFAEDSAILDLTLYEVGNVIWKETRRGKVRSFKVMIELFRELFEHMELLTLSRDLGEVLNIALKENLTFYDASYVYVARERGLRLVTKDRELLRLPEAVDLDEVLRGF